MAWFALHLAQVLFTLARDLFNFGSVALHLAQVLFTLARALFNFGLVCVVFSPGLVYFGWGFVSFWLGCPGLVYFG